MKRGLFLDSITLLCYHISVHENRAFWGFDHIRNAEKNTGNQKNT